MATVTCTIIGQKGRGGTSYNDKATYMGYSGSTAQDYVLAFTTGDFSGKSLAVKFNLSFANTAYSASTARDYRWALLSSDANALGTTSLYYKQTGLPADVTNDPYQIARGTVNFTNLGQYSQKTLTVEADSLQPNTNYFLVLWPAATNSIQVTMSTLSTHGGVTVEYDPVSDLVVRHYLCNEAGRTMYSTDSMTVEAGSNHVPETITPPESHTASGAVFFAYGSESGVNLGSGIADVDSFPANESAVVEINYPLAPGSIVVNVDGELWLADVYYKE